MEECPKEIAELASEHDFNRVMHGFPSDQAAEAYFAGELLRNSDIVSCPEIVTFNGEIYLIYFDDTNEEDDIPLVFVKYEPPLIGRISL
jgi:hypothetical protein